MAEKEEIIEELDETSPEDAESMEIDTSAEEETGEEVETDPEVLLKQKEDEIAELRTESLRTRADMENIRKRLQKEKQDAIQFANERLIRELAPILDNLERALAAPDSNPESLKEGVRMIAKQLHSLLDKQNVIPIPAVGEPFDPAVHEVLSQVETDEHEENTVIEECIRGYKMNGRVLIPAKVIIAKRPAANDSEASPDDITENAEPEA